MSSWTDFTKGKMGPYMKEYGSHGAAIRALSEEYRSSGLSKEKGTSKRDSPKIIKENVFQPSKESPEIKNIIKSDFQQFRKNISQPPQFRKNISQPPQFRKNISQPPQRNFRVRQKGITFLRNLQPAPALSKEQDMLQEMFNGEQTFGTGQNLPEVNGVLRSGGGLINNGDVDSETASMFGMRRNSYGFNQGEGGY